MNMKISWLIIGSMGSQRAQNGFMNSQPDFAHCHPPSCGGKEQKASARLTANKKMKEKNQIKKNAIQLAV